MGYSGSALRNRFAYAENGDNPCWIKNGCGTDQAGRTVEEWKNDAPHFGRGFANFRKAPYGVLTILLMAILFILFPLSGQAAAATLNVDGAAACSDIAGSPYCTIQAAITAAVNTDVVLVMPGTYQENIDFLGKAITVRSDQGAAVTIIDGGAAASVAYFGNDETTASVLEGFTLQNGWAGADPNTLRWSGGGVLIESASPTIRNNVITDNIADVPGFGISIEGGSSPIIDGNTISNNQASGDIGGGGGGAGIAIYGSSTAQIINNTITNNTTIPHFSDGGGIFLFGGGAPLIRNNLISGNSSEYGGGIGMVNSSSPLIIQNIIVGNTADEGGGIYWSIPATGHPVVVNNTIANNNGQVGSGIYADGFDSSAEVTNNIIFTVSNQAAVYCGDYPATETPIFNSNDIYSDRGLAYAGICTDQTGSNGNISADPLFLDTISGIYTLDGLSPAIDAGDSAEPNIPATDFAGNTRIFGSLIDMGAYEYFPGPGLIEFNASAYSASESTSSVVITVIRRGGDSGQVTVGYSTSDGSASAGSDYTAASGTLTFADGDTTEKSFTVTILDDETSEFNETVTLTLSNPTGGAALGSRSIAVLTITNDDSFSSEVYSFDRRQVENSGCFISTVGF